jgi:hypothetical protein
VLCGHMLQSIWGELEKGLGLFDSQVEGPGSEAQCVNLLACFRERLEPY